MIAVSIGASSGQSLPDAVDWLKALILGSIGTTVAILAIAAVGVLMLSGRIPIRRGATVVLGCFILFSAGTIASALLASLTLAGNDNATQSPQAPVYEASIPTPAPYDPFEGAAAPARRQRDLLE
jgi:type IV secretory pathway VirB2 component (pilin)